jgi:hypothetical protein
VPSVANPQSLNRYSYVVNNPLRFADPTGHRPVEEQGGTHGCSNSKYCQNGRPKSPSTKKSNDKDEISLGFDTRDICNYGNCKSAATAAGLAATALDSFAFGMNLTFMGIVDASAAIGFPMGLGAALAAYKLASPIPNMIGTMGGLMWGVQGVLLGTNYVAAGVTLNTTHGLINEAHISGAVSQDTIVAGVLDGSSWALPEPNSAAVVSGAGVAYDVLRNPLSPSLSSAPPIIPTIFNPNFAVSYDFTSNSGSISTSIFSP